MQTISLKLPDQLLAELNKTAKARRVTKSQLVRESLQQTLHPKRKGELSVFDLIGDLAGSIKGMPEDLATNPKYMEGFGE